MGDSCDPIRAQVNAIQANLDATPVEFNDQGHPIPNPARVKLFQELSAAHRLLADCTSPNLGGFIGLRFRASDAYAKAYGFSAGLPNFWIGGSGEVPVYGTLLFLKDMATWRDVSANDLGNPPVDDPGARLRATQDYAKRNGFVAGFPNYNEAGTVYGTILLRANAAEGRDATVGQLGSPPESDYQARFRSTFNYAKQNGFVGGFPNGYQADGTLGRVYGTILIPASAAIWRDIS